MRLPNACGTKTIPKGYRTASDTEVAEEGPHGVYRPTVIMRRGVNVNRLATFYTTNDNNNGRTSAALATATTITEAIRQQTIAISGSDDASASSAAAEDGDHRRGIISKQTSTNSVMAVIREQSQQEHDDDEDDDGDNQANNNVIVSISSQRPASASPSSSAAAIATAREGGAGNEDDDDGDDDYPQERSSHLAGYYQHNSCHNSVDEIDDNSQRQYFHHQSQSIASSLFYNDAGSSNAVTTPATLPRRLLPSEAATSVPKTPTVASSNELNNMSSTVSINQTPAQITLKAAHDTMSVKSAPMLSDPLDAAMRNRAATVIENQQVLQKQIATVSTSIINQKHQMFSEACEDLRRLDIHLQDTMVQLKTMSQQRQVITITERAGAQSNPPPSQEHQHRHHHHHNNRHGQQPNEGDGQGSEDAQQSNQNHHDQEIPAAVPQADSANNNVVSLSPGSNGNWRVVVAIDFGTTYSGYAFAFTSHPSRIYVMRRWQQGDPGLRDCKIPTALLLQPNGKFHSFGFEARNKYHSLDHDQAKNWLYFQNFKTILYGGASHDDDDDRQPVRPLLNENTRVEAANGSHVPALTVFAYVLRFFRQHALAEIDAMATNNNKNKNNSVPLNAIRWVVTVPAIWSQPAKQFMRKAAYMADLASPSRPEQLIIALEPEAASVFIRSLRLVDLPPQFPGSGIVDRLRPNSPVHSSYTLQQLLHNRKRSRNNNASKQQPGATATVFEDEDGAEGEDDDDGGHLACVDDDSEVICARETIGHSLGVGSRYVVVDCGGGTVDITVHELISGGIKELHKASGSNHGSLSVNDQFLELLALIFSNDFVDSFKYRRPAGYLDLLAAFESRKRAASPWKMTSLNVALPFNFLDLYQRTYHESVDRALNRMLMEISDTEDDQNAGGDGAKRAPPRKRCYSPVKMGDVNWSASGGVLRLYPPIVKRLFQPALRAIVSDVEHVLHQTASCGVDRLFVVGGFAESPMLQHELRQCFGQQYSVIIPPEPSLAVLRGAVAFGLDPGIVQVRHAQLTYGIGVLHRYDPKRHPRFKRILRFGTYWCTDVFDKFVTVNQPICEGDVVIRRYCPVSPNQHTAIVKLYACPNANAAFLTDSGVYLCGVLRLNLAPIGDEHLLDPALAKSRAAVSSRPQQDSQQLPSKGKREIQIRMSFGDTEIRCVALDVATNTAVSVNLDFLARPSPEGEEEIPNEPNQLNTSAKDHSTEYERSHLPDETDRHHHHQHHQRKKPKKTYEI